MEGNGSRLIHRQLNPQIPVDHGNGILAYEVFLMVKAAHLPDQRVGKHHLLFKTLQCKIYMIRKGDIHIWINGAVQHPFCIADDLSRYLYMFHGQVYEQFLKLIHGILAVQAEYLLHLFIINGTAFPGLKTNASPHDDDFPAFIVPGTHNIIIDYLRYFHNCS